MQRYGRAYTARRISLLFLSLLLGLLAGVIDTQALIPDTGISVIVVR